SCGRVPVGGGFVQTQHGRLPVPAPATLALLQGAGAPLESGGPKVELTTPTGACILAANVTEWTDLPNLTVRATGHGAGTRELEDRPNIVRLVLGQRAGSAGIHDQAYLLESNIDDMPGELFESLMDALFGAGALDVWFVPIFMKKNRPAYVVSALCAA